ncbi:opacity family porin [Candidatus Neomarinimicrobiota bacterium]
MKHLITIIMLTPILIFSQITENQSITSSARSSFYAGGSVFFGPGEQIKAGEKYYTNSDKESEDINISPNGSAGLEIIVGYNLTKSISSEFAIGWSSGGETIDKDNVILFKKAPLRLTLLYRIPIEKKYTPYIGAGLSTNLVVKYTEKSQGIDSEIKYSKPVGFHILGGASYKENNSPLFFFGELRVIVLSEYTVEEADIGGMDATSLLKSSDLDNLTATGMQFAFGMGYYFKKK